MAKYSRVIEYVIPEELKSKIYKLLDKDYRLTFYERIKYLLESEKLFESLPYPLRYGETLNYILSKISVVIQPDELIVGGVKEVIPSKEEYEMADKISRGWWDLPLEEIQKKILWFYSYNWLRRRPPWFYSFGHLGLQWEKTLSLGLKGFIENAQNRLADDKLDETKINFIKGSVICYKALSSFILRYGDALKDLAESTNDIVKRDEYKELSDICHKISLEPPETFREALQLLWFIIFPLMKVCGCGVFDLGRMDQYLYPFYKRDLDRGIITREDAYRLLIEFFYKNNEIMSPADHMSIEDPKTDYTIEVTFDDPNYIIIGGLLPGGKPGVNELSHIFIEAQHALRLRNPFIVVRYYSGIDDDFWDKTCAAMRDNATIVIYNDNTMIPALIRYGINEEDAYNYGFYGCNDPDITGKQGGLRQLWFNLVLPLELTLNEDRQTIEKDFLYKDQTQYSLEDRMIGLMLGKYNGIKTKSLNEIKCIDELIEEYKKQLGFLLKDYRNIINKDIEKEKIFNRGRIRIEDCFLDGPIDRALTWNDGGSIYNIITIQGSGLATVVDSLAAIEQLVFRDKAMSLEELVTIMKRNYSGYEDLQLKLRYRFPKFGNDIEWVDELARKVVSVFTEEVEKQNEGDHLYTFLPTLSTDRDFTTMGRVIGPTPDGRFSGDPISENQSPTLGCDKSGLTALLNSLSKVPFDRITGGPLNLRIHPSAVKGSSGLLALCNLLKTYMEKGGMQVQINIVGKEQLIEAQKCPEKYRNLCVRVVGYSAYFVQMGKKAQDELIQRTEHY